MHYVVLYMFIFFYIFGPIQIILINQHMTKTSYILELREYF